MSLPEEYTNQNPLGQPNLRTVNGDLSKSPFQNLDMGEGNSLGKVRDILFGNQMREIEKKFARLEESLVKECTNLRVETRKRLDALENYIQKEVEFLAEQLKEEQTGREQAVKNLAEGQNQVVASLEKKLVQVNEESSESQRKLREQIFNQSNNLQDDIREKYQEVMALLERETQELRSDKTDRSRLAALFSELAIRLNALP